MPRKLVEKTIGKHRYRIRQLGSVSQDEIIASVVLGASTGKVTVADVAGARDTLMAQTEVEVVDELSPNASKPRTWVALASVYDELLADDMMERVLWLDAAVEVSFGNFTAALGVLTARQAALSSSSSAPSTDGSATASSSPNA